MCRKVSLSLGWDICLLTTSLGDSSVVADIGGGGGLLLGFSSNMSDFQITVFFLCGCMDHKGVHCQRYTGSCIHKVKSLFGVWLRAGQAVLGSGQKCRGREGGIGERGIGGWKVQAPKFALAVGDEHLAEAALPGGGMTAWWGIKLTWGIIFLERENSLDSFYGGRMGEIGRGRSHIVN